MSTVEMAPIGTVDAVEEQGTSERSLTLRVVFRIEVESEVSSEQEERNTGKFSRRNAR
jgi:hypothetical protein